MRVIHVSGAMLSGKTWVCEPYCDNPNVAYWSMSEFYEERKVIVNNKMDWDRWDQEKNNILPDLKCFVDKNQDKKVCIIESGTNATVNAFTNEIVDLVPIQLRTPDNETIKARAKERGLDLDVVLEFNKVFQRRHAHNDKHQYSQAEASLMLKAHIEGVRVSIIGSAGRKEDASKMDKGLYLDMFKKAYSFLDRYHLLNTAALVSGGAAYADHLAVSLYLNDSVPELKLYLPSRFDVTESKFFGYPDSKYANYYHREFSLKMGGNTMLGISKAIAKGAETEVVMGFKNRNLEVAKCDLMIAFTFGPGNKPKERSGTLHTWNNSNAPIKIHVPLGEL